MSKYSRRKLLTGGAAAIGGVAGLAAAAGIAKRYGLVPPDSGGLYGPGATLTYAASRLLVGNSKAREFSREQISTHPFPNSRKPPEEEAYGRLQAAGFREWPLAIEGLVARPATYTLEGVRRLPVTSQITQLTCEEGWSFIAEWSGVTLRHLLELAGVQPRARYVVYLSMESWWHDSLDIDEALHPQTLVCYGMNGRDLPVGHGGPLRLRVPRQLGYKSVKYITRLVVTDDLEKTWKQFGKTPPDFEYSWFAGI